jgi:hypothetical protein
MPSVWAKLFLERWTDWQKSHLQKVRQQLPHRASKGDGGHFKKRPPSRFIRRPVSSVRYIIVVFGEIDDDTIIPWTAYEVPEP